MGMFLKTDTTRRLSSEEKKERNLPN